MVADIVLRTERNGTCTFIYHTNTFLNKFICVDIINMHIT